ncbi:tRNA (N(6)-L-threonylcarbamoyladenosine(37)-C(2))-methylthiotransferase MtaB [Eubacterium sp. An3]|uniref:tRNA (N(6)-L-threonylcarbamoyladenosine(37)-C(2))- methylthiotransferase MtaB n=1 Tax=Eubacterium sp. An3 TaxID=1965628 RepID=UPI000B551461|nr:tRNA (N(6)-L-threonylcarbamoyladenosine(37)-C(2))-methylthiotransferase MtaB [Eubacterium sp. An3]OUO28600.1 tRNA (N(6)-L-threonylcarbamoyladenosine(37)-C(2))-methylthiotransferase MtaB [Eubacterium sp. An3]
MTESLKAAFLTLGCKVNQYETDAMRELLEAAGYDIVDFKERADVYIINTCSVTNMADRKSRQMIHRARKKNPDAVVVAAGCYVQAAENELKEKGIADVLIGNNKKKDIVRILEEYFQKGEKTAEVLDISCTNEYESLTIHKISEHTRAYIKIQDGCNQFCSYCIIPYTRGRIRSKQLEDVIREIRALAREGYKEVVLTGIHLSSYGMDFPEENRTDLLAVIENVQEIDGIERIRLGSLEPRIITEEFAQGLKKCSKVCPHFHLSLQSGCDETLKRMNRKYTTEEYKKALAILRDTFEHPALTTDVIVGFAGETEEEFEKTRAYLEEINLYEMHIFKFSVRKGTRAERMPGQVPEDVKTKRSAVLLAMTERHKKDFEQWYIGRKEKVLLEEMVEINGTKYMQGHTERYVKVVVNFDENSEILRQNHIVAVKIQGFLDENLLYGKVSIEF